MEYEVFYHFRIAGTVYYGTHEVTGANCVQDAMQIARAARPNANLTITQVVESNGDRFKVYRGPALA
jgi:hypothetical protein